MSDFVKVTRRSDSTVGFVNLDVFYLLQAVVGGTDMNYRQGILPGPGVLQVKETPEEILSRSPFHRLGSK